jgi:hypothetical protein
MFQIIISRRGSLSKLFCEFEVAGLTEIQIFTKFRTKSFCETELRSLEKELANAYEEVSETNAGSLKNITLAG